MSQALRLLAVLPHPDDESLGLGSTLAKYSAEGVETFLLCATRGERGWAGLPDENPGLEALGRLREDELRCAARRLGLHQRGGCVAVDGALSPVYRRRILRPAHWTAAPVSANPV